MKDVGGGTHGRLVSEAAVIRASDNEPANAGIVKLTARSAQTFGLDRKACVPGERLPFWLVRISAPPELRLCVRLERRCELPVY